MPSTLTKIHVAILSAMLLLPIGCNSSSVPADVEVSEQSQQPAARQIPTQQEIESKVITENLQSGETLVESNEPLTIQIAHVETAAPVVAPKVVAKRPAVLKVARVESVPLEAAAEEAPAVEKKAEKVVPATPIFRRPSIPEVADIDEEATHYQAGLIEVSKGTDDPHRVNAFCLDADGNIVAVCGAGPGEVRKLDADGKLLDSWKVEIKPEAVNVAKDGTILVGGHGRLMRFASDSKLIASAESPHAASIRESKEKLREQVVQQLKSQSSPRASLASRVETYERIISQLEARKKEGTLGEQEEQILASLPKTLELMKKQLADQPEENEEPKVNEAAVERQLESMMASKMRISSISADSDHVYVATYALEGYSFNVWQLDQNFKNGKVVIEELRGCCGQMDVQASDNGIFVAENARFRVACFNPTGDLKTTWGKGDRTGADGFTSCCNPMNVCFGGNGDVFTAESNTGRIKQFSADGKLKNFIGDVKLVPGCKNVSIAVSPDGDRVYMLDITRNHIVLMKKKSEKPEEEKSPKVTLNN